MARYFRSYPAGEKSNRYIALSDKPRVVKDEENPQWESHEYPMGSVGVTASDEQFIPHWGDSKPIGRSFISRDMVQETGLSTQFLEHLTLQADRKTRSRDMQTRDSANQLLDSITKVKHDKKMTPEDWQRHVDTVKNHPWANPDTLFTHVPAQVQVYSAFFDPDMKYHFPTTLGIIKQDYPNHEITAPTDLSVHSSKLVRHAANKGLLTEGKDALQTNTSSFGRRAADPYSLKEIEREDEEITPEEVASARKGLKDMLSTARRARKGPEEPQQHMSPQFNQPTLFD